MPFTKNTKDGVRTLVIPEGIGENEFLEFMEEYIKRYKRNGKSRHPKLILTDNYSAYSILLNDNRIDCLVQYTGNVEISLPNDLHTGAKTGRIATSKEITIDDVEVREVKADGLLGDNILAEPTDLSDWAKLDKFATLDETIEHLDKSVEEQIEEGCIANAEYYKKEAEEMKYVSKEADELLDEHSKLLQQEINKTFNDFVETYDSMSIGGIRAFDVLEIVWMLNKENGNFTYDQAIVDSKNADGTYNLVLEKDDSVTKYDVPWEDIFRERDIPMCGDC